jgi:hypothetical protein
MKTLLHIVLFTLFFGIQSQSQIIINEFQPETNTIELKNIGNTTVDVSSYEACSFPEYNAMDELTLVSGTLLMAPGDITVVQGHAMGVADDELGLYTMPSYTNPDAMLDYVEWGSSGHQRSTVAVAAGIWNTNDFLEFFPLADETYMWDGLGDAPSNWFADPDTFGAENEAPQEECAGGTVSTADGETAVDVIVGDGTADVIEFEAEGGVGSYSFVVTDNDGEILAVLEGNSNDFEGAGEGVCRLYGAGYFGGLSAAVGTDITAATADSCFSLSSNFVEITRTPTSVEENVLLSLNVWPNPAIDLVNVQVPSAMRGGVLNVINLQGQIILTQQANKLLEQMNLESLSSGHYILELISSAGIARSHIQK